MNVQVIKEGTPWGDGITRAGQPINVFSDYLQRVLYVSAELLGREGRVLGRRLREHRGRWAGRRAVNHFHDPLAAGGGGYTVLRCMPNDLSRSIRLHGPAQRERTRVDRGAFRAMGQMMHLIEDNTVPDHARDLAHPGDGFEEWLAKDGTYKKLFGHTPVASWTILPVRTLATDGIRAFWHRDGGARREPGGPRGRVCSASTGTRALRPNAGARVSLADIGSRVARGQSRLRLPFHWRRPRGFGPWPDCHTHPKP